MASDASSSPAVFDASRCSRARTSEIDVTSPKVTFEAGAYGYGFAVFGLNDEILSVGHIGALPVVNVVSAVEINPTLGRTIIIVCERGFDDIEPVLIAYQVAINMGYFRG